VAFFYGHSFGGIVAWLVAGLLQERKSAVRVVRLFVGGEESPARPGEKTNTIAKMTTKEFAASLVKRKMLSAKQGHNADEIFLKMLEPTKAEFQMDEEFDLSKLRHRPPVLACPISAYYEAEDDSYGLQVEHVETWEQFSDKKAAFECTPVVSFVILFADFLSSAPVRAPFVPAGRAQPNRAH
jgi:surfactin synthase thioesterase subunit